jgi:flagellar protein FlgJ
MAAHDFSQINALDPNTLSGLRRLSKENSPEATREAAKQFEALFLQQVLKSMRDASPKNSMFDSEESRMYQSMLDQQMSLQLATRGGGMGLARVIERQLSASREVVTPPEGGVSLDASIRRGFDAAVAASPHRDGPFCKRSGNAGGKNCRAAAGYRCGKPCTGEPAQHAGGYRPPCLRRQSLAPGVEASRVTGIPARFLLPRLPLKPAGASMS